MSQARAVAVARAHVEAWSNHDFDVARQSLADDVHVVASTTQPGIPKTELAGIDAYMEGLKQFAHVLETGGARGVARHGDDRNALLMGTVPTIPGAMGPAATLRGARLYLLDDDGKIKSEQVIYYLSPSARIDLDIGDRRAPS